MRKIVSLLIIGFLCIGLIGATEPACGIQNNTDQRQRAETERMTREAHQKLGLPNITNFTERRFAKLILELRDSEISTYTYIVDFQGRLHFVCPSIGYGLPYSVQYTNPERYTHGGGTLPQADPNGLFMPQGLDATFVLCSDGKGGIKPMYSEPKLLVSPVRLNAVGNYLP